MTLGVCGLSFVIQSDYSTSYLDDRIEASIMWVEVSNVCFHWIYPLFILFRFILQEYIAKLDEKEFESEKSSLILRLLKTKKKLVNLSMQIWSEIGKNEYFFKRNEAMAEIVKRLTKDEMLAFFKVCTINGFESCCFTGWCFFCCSCTYHVTHLNVRNFRYKLLNQTLNWMHWSLPRISLIWFQRLPQRYELISNATFD